VVLRRANTEKPAFEITPRSFARGACWFQARFDAAAMRRCSRATEEVRGQNRFARPDARASPHSHGRTATAAPLTWRKQSGRGPPGPHPPHPRDETSMRPQMRRWCSGAPRFRPSPGRTPIDLGVHQSVRAPSGCRARLSRRLLDAARTATSAPRGAHGGGRHARRTAGEGVCKARTPMISLGADGELAIEQAGTHIATARNRMPTMWRRQAMKLAKEAALLCRRSSS